MKKQNKNKPKGQGNLTRSIMDILRKNSGKTYNYKQIASILGVNDASSRNQIIKKLAQLTAKKEIEERFNASQVAETHHNIFEENGYKRHMPYSLNNMVSIELKIGRDSSLCDNKSALSNRPCLIRGLFRYTSVW